MASKTPDLAVEILEEKDLWGQVQDHLKIAGPVISAFVLRKVVMITSVVAVGHLGAHFLAAAGLASVTANVTGNSMVIGLSGALVTLCSQANGANNKTEMNHAMQRALIILWLFICLPASVLWLCSEPIMVFLGQNEAIARSTKDYMVVLIPGLWALSASQCITTWLYAQAKTQAVASITLAVALLHPLWLYLFIYYFQIGFLGSAVALSLTKCIELIILLLYINVFSSIIKDTEFAWSSACWQHWVPFLKLGLPNLLMMSEWWASEIIIFMSGALPDPEIQMGAMSIYQNMLALCFMLPGGVREACSTIIGNAIGAGKANVARSSSFIAPALALVGCAIMSAFVIPFRYSIGRVFTSDAQVIHLLGTLAPVFAAYVISDGQQAVLTGVIKGLGKQYIAGPIVVFSYYAVGIPLSTLFALDLNGHGLNMGVKGLCIGTLVGTIVHMLCFMVIVYARTDMQVEVNRVAENNLIKGKSTSDNNEDQTGNDMNINMNMTVNPMQPSINSNRSTINNKEGEDDVETWWDDLSFLGIETTLPGRTAVNRNNNGLIGALTSTWRDFTYRLYSLGNTQRTVRVNHSNQQYASVQGSSRHGFSSNRRGGERGNKSRSTSSAGNNNNNNNKSSFSEYELVKAYTDVLGGPSAHGLEDEDDDYLDIDFDFI